MEGLGTVWLAHVLHWVLSDAKVKCFWTDRTEPCKGDVPSAQTDLRHANGQVGVLGDVLSNAPNVTSKGRLGPGQMICADYEEVSSRPESHLMSGSYV